MATWCLVLATFVLAATGICAILFTSKQLTSERDQRRVDNTGKILEEFNGPTIRACRKRYVAARLQGGRLLPKDDLTFPEAGTEILDFFERVGFLSRNHHLHDEQVWSSLGNWIGAYDHDMHLNISSLRMRQKTAYVEFSWLVEQLGTIDKANGGLFFTPYQTEELERLYAYELSHGSDGHGPD